MTVIDRCLLGARRGMLALSLFALYPIGDSVAQSAPTLGYAAAKNANPDRLDVFKTGLTELGYVEGKTVWIEYREGVLDADYRRLMAEFVDHKVNVILAANAPAAVTAAKATTTIPIVMLAVNDPVGLGLVKSSSRRKSRGVADRGRNALHAERSALAKLGLTLPPDIAARVNEWID